MLEKYDGIRYFYLEHSGIATARNIAVKVARGKWIAFLDSDDLWKEEKLQKQMDYVRVRPDCRIVYTAFSNFTDIPEDELNERQKKLLQTVGKWCLPSALIDAGLFEEIGMFDESLKYGEDTDWNYRLVFSKIDTSCCLNEVLYLRRVHSSNITSTSKIISNLEFWKRTIDIYRKAKRARRNSL